MKYCRHSRGMRQYRPRGNDGRRHTPTFTRSPAQCLRLQVSAGRIISRSGVGLYWTSNSIATNGTGTNAAASQLEKREFLCNVVVGETFSIAAIFSGKNAWLTASVFLIVLLVIVTVLIVMYFYCCKCKHNVWHEAQLNALSVIWHFCDFFEFNWLYFPFTSFK